MKKLTLVIIYFSVVLCSYSQKTGKNLSLIPEPVSMVYNTGENFILPSKIIVVIPKNEAVKKTAERFVQQLTTATGYAVTIKEGTTALPKSIFFSLTNDKTIPKEGYRLKTTESGTTLTANEPAGIFYGVINH